MGRTLCEVINKFTGHLVGIGFLENEKTAEKYVFSEFIPKKNNVVIQDLSIGVEGYNVRPIKLYAVLDDIELVKQIRVSLKQIVKEGDILVLSRDTDNCAIIGQVNACYECLSSISERYARPTWEEVISLSNVLYISKRDYSIKSREKHLNFYTNLRNTDAFKYNLDYASGEYKRIYELYYSPEYQSYTVLGEVF